MEKHIRVNGLGIRVVVRPGVTGTAPLLLCGGIGMGLEALQPLVDALDPAVTVIRFDAPGAGGSPAALVPLGYPGNASLAAGLIGELGYPQADVLGLSWGGGLAQQLALQHPARVRRMILVGSGPGALGYSPGPAVLRHLLTPHRLRDKGIAPDLYGGSVREHPERASALGSGGSITGYVHQALAGFGWSSLPWLPMICQPALILAGDDDPIMPPANGRLLSSLLPHAVLHVYRGGHLALITEADALAPVISDFITAQPEDVAAATGLAVPAVF